MNPSRTAYYNLREDLLDAYLHYRNTVFRVWKEEFGLPLAAEWTPLSAQTAKTYGCSHLDIGNLNFGCLACEKTTNVLKINSPALRTQHFSNGEEFRLNWVARQGPLEAKCPHLVPMLDNSIEDSPRFQEALRRLLQEPSK